MNCLLSRHRLIFFIFSLICLGLSCSTTVDRASKIIGGDSVYQGAGIERYFLPLLPEWANFSQTSECKRNFSIRYLDFQSVGQSYSLNYRDMIHFQNMVNRRITSFRKNNPTATLYLKDEVYIFNNSYQLLIGGSFDFIRPKYSKISALWLDPLLKVANLKKRVTSILSLSSFQKGFPLLVSNCLNSFELEEFIIKHNLSRFGVRGIGAEMFSPYDANLEMSQSFSLDLNAFFNDKDIIVFSTKEAKHIKANKISIIK